MREILKNKIIIVIVISLLILLGLLGLNQYHYLKAQNYLNEIGINTLEINKKEIMNLYQNLKSYHYNGIIEEVNSDSILVSSHYNNDLKLASVQITQSTLIINEEGEKTILAGNEGFEVIICYSGHIRESYPVQITATVIIILK